MRLISGRKMSESWNSCWNSSHSEESLEIQSFQCKKNCFDEQNFKNTKKISWKIWQNYEKNVFFFLEILKLFSEIRFWEPNIMPNYHKWLSFNTKFHNSYYKHRNAATTPFGDENQRKKGLKRKTKQGKNGENKKEEK